MLDIGCGWGSSVLLISKFAKKVYGIDISDMAIEGAKMNLKFFQKNNVEIKRNDAEKLEFEDQLSAQGIVWLLEKNNRLAEQILFYTVAEKNILNEL